MIEMASVQKCQYGQGVEAKRAWDIKSRPELSDFLASTSPQHWAYRQLEEIIGTQNMRARRLRELALRLGREFPNEAGKCERGLLRLWAGCVQYLLKNEHLLHKMQNCEGIGEVQRIPNDFAESTIPRLQIPYTTQLVFPSVQQVLRSLGMDRQVISPRIPFFTSIPAK
jgi:hypothetical protein